MLEAYQAYGDYETMMELLQSLICQVAEKVLGTLVIEQKDAEGNVRKTIDLTPDWRRAKYKDLVREAAGADWFEITTGQRRERAAGDLKIELDSNVTVKIGPEPTSNPTPVMSNAITTFARKL